MKNFKYFIASMIVSMLFLLPTQNLFAHGEHGGHGGEHGGHHENAEHHNNMHDMHHDAGHYNNYHHNWNGEGASGTVINENPQVIVPVSPNNPNYVPQ
jgi:hypothetical protein